MLDKDIAALVHRDRDALAGLEAGIWNAVAERQSAQSETRRIASWQAAVMLVAVIGSASIGVALGAQLPPRGSHIMLAYDASAPYDRLFGGKP